MATFTRPPSFNVPFLQCIIAMSSSDIPLSHLYSVKLLMASCLVRGVVSISVLPAVSSASLQQHCAEPTALTFQPLLNPIKPTVSNLIHKFLRHIHINMFKNTCSTQSPTCLLLSD